MCSVCMYICRPMYVCMYVQCMYVCKLCIYVGLCMYVSYVCYDYPWLPACMYACMYMFVCMHACIFIYVLVFIYVCMYVCLQVWIRTSMDFNSLSLTSSTLRLGSPCLNTRQTRINQES